MYFNSLILIVALLAGTFLRFYFFSGDGLGDDPNFFASYYFLFDGMKWHESAYNYRFALWLPIVILFKIFGVTEFSWMLYITLSSIVNIYIIFLICKELFDEKVAVAAALLMAFNPFDTTFSTTFVNDIPLSLFISLGIYFFIKGMRTSTNKYRYYFPLSAFFCLLCYYTKMWGLFILPIFGILSLLHIREYKKHIYFYITIIILFTLSPFVDYLISGKFFGYYHNEVKVAGLWTVTRETLLIYPRQMLWPNEYGVFYHGLYFHLLIPCLFFCWKYRKEVYIPLIWLFVLFFFMEFFPQKITLEGWYSQARIFRYLAILVTPIVIILAFFSIRIYFLNKKVFYLLFAVFLPLSVYQTKQLSFVSRDAFEDRRLAADYIITLNEKPIYSDFSMLSYIERFKYNYKRPDLIHIIKAENPISRAAEFSQISNAYVITGGARLPYYGCQHCIANLDRYEIPENWSLLKTFYKDVTPWRKEPLKLWEVKEGSATNKIVSQYYRDIQLLFNDAQRYFSANKLDEAERIYKQLLSKYEQRYLSYQIEEIKYYYGITLMRKSRYDEALKIFNEFLTDYSDSQLVPEIYYHIGLCEIGKNNKDKAIKAWEKVIHDYPHSPAAKGSAERLSEVRKTF